jgi:hypothetical protein
MRFGAITFVLFVLSLATSGAAACPLGTKYAGRTVQPRDRPIRVGRAGRAVQVLGGAGILCTDDEVFADDRDVLVVFTYDDRHHQVVEKGHSLRIPTRTQYWITVIRAAVPFFDQERQEARSAVSLGSDGQLRFDLAGLNRPSIALLGSQHDRLLVPIRKFAAPATAELIDPSGRIARQELSADQDLIVFPAPRQLGRWRLRVVSDGRTIDGQFQVVASLPVPPEIEHTGLVGDDRFLAQACLDIGRFGLDAFQSIGSAHGGEPPAELRATLSRWSDPATESFCAADPPH